MFRSLAGGGAVEEEIGADGAPVAGSAKPIRVRRPDNDALVVVASKSHRDKATDDYIARYRVADFRSAGSSLKFCLIASKDRRDKTVNVAEQLEKAQKALNKARYRAVLRIGPGEGTFFHGWEKETAKALSWFDGTLDWPKEIEEEERK